MRIFRKLLLCSKFEVPETHKIYYTALKKITPYSIVHLPSIISNTYDSSTKEGVITCISDITYIGDRTFYNCTDLRGITIPDSVTSIENSAFHACTQLKNINIPNGVTDIGNNAFNSCALTSITIPDTVTNIGYESFCRCNDLQSVNIPKNVINIGIAAFSGCTGNIYIDCDIKSQYKITQKIFGNSVFNTVTFSDNVTIINHSVLADCTMNNLIISKSVQDIKSQYDQSLGLNPELWHYWVVKDSISVDKDNPIFTDDSNCLINKNTNTLIKGCNNSIIPNYVKTIYSYAFSSCVLNNFIIPNNIQSAGSYPFMYTKGNIIVQCDISNIEGLFLFSRFDIIDLNNDNIVSLPNYIFKGSSIKKIIFSKNITTISSTAFDYATIDVIDLTRFESIPNFWENMYTKCQFIVPDALYDDWIVAENWSTYADHIVKASEYTETT